MSDDKERPQPKVVEKNEVDPSSFRVQARDTKGHTQRMWFNCQPAHAAELDAIHQSKAYPYRTKGDIIRHALVRHFRWLYAIGGPIPSVTGVVDTVLTILRDDEFFADYNQVMDTLMARVNMHRGNGDIDEARRLLLECVNHIQRMPNTFWKKKYLDRIHRDHGELLKSAPRGNITSFKED